MLDLDLNLDGDLGGADVQDPRPVGDVDRAIGASKRDIYCILYWIFGIFWVSEIFTALGQFVLAYSVTLYYFTVPDFNGKKKAPSFPLEPCFPPPASHLSTSCSLPLYFLPLTRPPGPAPACGRAPRAAPAPSRRRGACPAACV